MDDKQIIDLLFARNETGLQLTEQKYSRMYNGILRQTLNNESDVDECGNDVLMALWNSIPPQYPSHYPSYICTIARRIGINRFKHETRQKRGRGYTVLLSELGECIPAPEADAVSADIRAAMAAFLKELDEQTRVLFLRRYYYMESVKSIAQRFELSESNVSVRLHRARKLLKTLLEKEGVSL